MKSWTFAAMEREGAIVVTDYDGMLSDCRLASAEWPRHGVMALSFDDRQMIGNVIMGENYHTDIEDIVRAIRRAGERAETISIVSHGISPNARGISMKTEWLERLLSESRSAGVIVRGVR